ncbi:NADPH-dependent FMN reductase [Limnothrix sp. PR1529]|uniref:flavodoxin family protein n=1 Tax=Limnothrix sp. PR1529 TaxID=1704291 RepID=UPI00081E92EC|nr:flavodoxin family protein [Limnothrix sp. PR1529]OCQ93179.1 NADPH-dependent FMN reductase [Limnothrix sp. P13C2]PIB09823.1 NADPH-dependent FMN reductase [Limnothrix sp. PR1529]
MTTISVVYFSGSGHTHLMAESVARGASQVDGVTAGLLRITGAQITEGRWKDPEMLDALTRSDAIVFGSPTYMGGVAAQFKAFVDAASSAWFAQQWKDKIAGGFTHSGSPSGDKQGTLLYMAINAAQHGMIWVGAAEMPSQYVGSDEGVNRLGSFLGVMGQSDLNPNGGEAIVHPGDRLTAEKYGQRIATIAQRHRGS